jgi:hypothetical protein
LKRSTNAYSQFLKALDSSRSLDGEQHESLTF